MNRRQLLSRGAAVVGGTLVATSLQSPPARGEEKPEENAPTSTPPNLDPPVVQVNAGKLRGFRDGSTTIFLGIPYAEAERFELPKPVQPWEGIKSAQVWGPVCPILNLTAPGAHEFVFPHRYWLQNEHCQVLNVWTQDLSSDAKKPVMVWIHGGGFADGSSMEAYAFESKNLSEFGDVVVVSMNHRVNIIGTLNLWPTVLNMRNRATLAPPIWWPPCSGSTTTSRTSAATRTT